MKIFVITGTITHALRGRDLLRNFGYTAARIERIQHKYENAGCGYGIIVTGESNEIKRLLDSSGIKVLGIDVTG